ncbi:calcium/sodium antiporter [Pseudoroseicyclus aestuarii]|uniref:Cation:H+ antiporter n=1 Tax=Pseudoroseicyclus aestuarii TaxID=1795041 RepID=A0A318SP88_9RHOB|nr:calcium/sodium antiporter [Pseudoroseicyclus aestuarii]PYE83690.1 cation:H+ antiporter [Pseudoroseicyclus aestuarii]
MLWIALAAGLVLLVAGGEALVRGASALASRLGVSPLLVGLTVVGFGTSTPELVTSLQAALSGSPGIAFGNVIGSNTANILLILGLAALLSPFAVERRAFLRDGPALALATLACLGVVLWGALSRPAGAVLVVGLILYLLYAYRSERGLSAAEAAPEQPAMRLSIAALWAVGGIALTVLGARLLVDASITLAALWGVPDEVIGLTVVAIGTSLPELVTTVVAALRRQGEIAFGNVVGSNLYNILGILGITALVRPIPVPPQIAALDIWVMLAATVALVAVCVSGWRATRGEGAVLLAAYGLYIGWLALGSLA